MTAVTNLIAQHSQGWLVGKSEFKPVIIPPGTEIVPNGRRWCYQLQGRASFGWSILGNGWYRVVSAIPEFSGMVFDVAGASQASGARRLILWPWHGGPNAATFSGPRGRGARLR